MKFHFRNSDLNASEFIQLCNFPNEIKNCYGTQPFAVGRISFSAIRLKPDARLQTQRPIRIAFLI